MEVGEHSSTVSGRLGRDVRVIDSSHLRSHLTSRILSKLGSFVLSEAQHSRAESLSRLQPCFLDAAKEIAKGRVPKVPIFENEKTDNVHLAWLCPQRADSLYYVLKNVMQRQLPSPFSISRLLPIAFRDVNARLSQATLGLKLTIFTTCELLHTNT